MKRAVILILLSVVTLKCSESDSPTRNAVGLTLEHKQKIAESTERLLGAWKPQCQTLSAKDYRTTITYDRFFADYRGRITDETELRMWDDFMNIPEIQDYYKGMRSMMEINANGRVNTTYWDESDFVSAYVKGLMGDFAADLDYTMASMPNSYLGDVTYAMLARVDVFAEAVGEDTNLTTDEADHILGTVEMLRHSIPNIVEEQMSYADPEGKTQINWSRLRAKVGSVIVHMAYGALIVSAIVAAVVLTGGSAAAILLEPAIVYIGSAAFTMAAITVAAGGAAGLVVGTAMALNDQCLSVPTIVTPYYTAC